MSPHDDAHAAAATPTATAPTTGNGHTHGHSQGHTHGNDSFDFDWGVLSTQLEQEAEIRGPLYRQAAEWISGLLPAPGARRVLDIGSGPGVVSALLADVFPAAEVVAVDSTPELLERTAARAELLGLKGRVSTRLAELPDAVDTLGEADVIWAGNSLHHLGDQLAALEGFARRLRPGGVLALLEGGLSARHLPRDLGTGMGRPGLEVRFEARLAEWFGAMRSELPGAVRETEDWPALLTAAGLEPSGTRSFLLDIPAPAPLLVREQLVRTFTRLRDKNLAEGSADDREVLDRLLDPEDPRGLLKRPDVFLLEARTVHTARKV
ncbi:class I SAM-dependent methyltransferase [Streptomyces sp. NBC_01317]|uniref:class I SAM-dependent methyltransferase n=1 Tax=Streptomyces sp. NBC_01317 TaxID=2903822 RepID=UPI002E0E3405|nr:class I SAM-dependent methyltransferase [Streptomyces sp. NBC_01317]